MRTVDSTVVFSPGAVRSVSSASRRASGLRLGKRPGLQPVGTAPPCESDPTNGEANPPRLSGTFSRCRGFERMRTCRAAMQPVQ
jgi:hypothetical protein